MDQMRRCINHFDDRFPDRSEVLMLIGTRRDEPFCEAFTSVKSARNAFSRICEQGGCTTLHDHSIRLSIATFRAKKYNHEALDLDLLLALDSPGHWREAGLEVILTR